MLFLSFKKLRRASLSAAARDVPGGMPEIELGAYGAQHARGRNQNGQGRKNVHGFPPRVPRSESRTDWNPGVRRPRLAAERVAWDSGSMSDLQLLPSGAEPGCIRAEASNLRGRTDGALRNPLRVSVTFRIAAEIAKTAKMAGKNCSRQVLYMRYLRRRKMPSPLAKRAVGRSNLLVLGTR